LNVDATSTVLEVAQIAGPVFTAVAALAACIAVYLTLHETRMSRQPSLRIQALVSPATGFYGATIMNAGDGVASGVNFVVADSETVIAGPVLSGFLRPGESVDVFSTQSPAVSEDRYPVVGYVTGRDRFGFPHDWTTDLGHAVNYERTWRSRFRKAPVYGEVIPRLAKWFPDRPSPKDLTQIHVSSQTRMTQGLR
jgi:hypothetical protein